MVLTYGSIICVLALDFHEVFELLPVISALLAVDFIYGLRIFVADVRQLRCNFELDLFVVHHIKEIVALLVADARVLPLGFVGWLWLELLLRIGLFLTW